MSHERGRVRLQRVASEVAILGCKVLEFAHQGNPAPFNRVGVAESLGLIHVFDQTSVLLIDYVDSSLTLTVLQLDVPVHRVGRWRVTASDRYAYWR